MSHSQDVEAGDGTTSVVVIAGAFLQAAQRLVKKGLHPNAISKAFGLAVEQVEPILRSIAVPIDIRDKDIMVQNCVTSLSSKIVSSNAEQLAKISVDAVLSIVEYQGQQGRMGPDSAAHTTTSAPLFNADLRRVKIIKQLGAPVEESYLLDEGLALGRQVSHQPKAPTSINDAVIGLIQFCISPPKTDMDSTVTVGTSEDMRRTVERERRYILDICKKIKACGITVLLVQKSILRDALDSMAKFYLAKLNVMVIEEVERDEVPFVCDALGCLPIASLEQLDQLANEIENEKKGVKQETDVGKKNKQRVLGKAKKVEEVTSSHSASYVKFTGVQLEEIEKEKESSTNGVVHTRPRPVCIICCGPNKLLLEEAERSLHDALCVARSLVKQPFLLPGGGACEIELAVRLEELARGVGTLDLKQELSGLDSVCIRAFAESLEAIPLTLAENAGMNPISILTQLRAAHTMGRKTNVSAEDKLAGQRTGINMRRLGVGDMVQLKVVQPLLVTLSAVTLATETVRQILRIDDIVAAR
ncbi:MAG: putative T-complex protein 1 subunit delta [Streblomastix strix]|uniref:Putative T-complex protein 1 subunit delta n=1 Tax=Streblomastix strix TaxID=222440 RepID=A0A5J4X1U8_9EUKA|nr:MAG: putative T-complex protein 1 subunit delta [Streblomastix strix]